MGSGMEVIDAEIKELPERALEKWTPKFVVTIDEAVARRDENVEYMRRVLKPGVHYGVIPGTSSKPSLLKPGAQALCRDMGLHPEPVILEHIKDEMGKDHDGEPFLAYNMRVDLYSVRFEPRRWVGSGVGSANSWEERYRWRTATRRCPDCGKEAIIKGKFEYGGGWVCFKKKDGCGAKFGDADERITSQEVGRVPNDRVMDLDNTIFKQASKRALVEAVLNVTGASDVFTQDLDDSDEVDEDESSRTEASKSQSPSASPPNKRGSALAEMTPDHRAAIDTLRMNPANAERVKQAQEQLKEWGFKTWGQFIMRGTSAQADEIQAVLSGEAS
jgi:hypothetical protein